MTNSDNQVKKENLEIHDWYRFVLSFPPELITHYLKKFNITEGRMVMDPFCGTGTTNVECKKMGISSIGIEANPITYFASRVKCSWDCNAAVLCDVADSIAEKATVRINSGIMPNLPPEQEALLIKNSISSIPLRKVLILRDAILDIHSPFQDYFLLALAKHVVYSYSNLKFGPEVGISRKRKYDVDVISIWLEQIKQMQRDLIRYSPMSNIMASIYSGDSRTIRIPEMSHKVDFVITSPPYPNEKDYSRTTRLESVILGFVKSKDELRSIKRQFIRSNTKNVYKGDCDDIYINDLSSITALSNQIEETRIRLGKDSGFERLYHRVVRLYFGGMARHLINIKPMLKNGAYLAYVVGDQSSYFQIPIETSKLLAEVVKSVGNYRIIQTDLFRRRFSTTTDMWLNENVLIFKYNERA